MKNYIETLEESNEELSKRLADAEKYIAWKDSYKRLRFKYVIMYHCVNQSGLTGWVGVCLTRSNMLEYICMFKTMGKNVLIEHIEKTYETSINVLELQLRAHHGKEQIYDNNQAPIAYKTIVHIGK